MNFHLFISIPAEDEDREGPPKSRYVSKKDIKWLTVGLVVLLIMLFPIYSVYRNYKDQTVCAYNMNAIYQAISNYAESHDDRFPPVAEEANSHAGTPYVPDNGLLHTWVTLAFSSDPRPSIFKCPASEPAETYPSEGDQPRTGATPAKIVKVDSSYGMYRGYSAAMRSGIEHSSEVVLFSETSNFGAESSYDPQPFLDHGHSVPYDGFSIGWDTGNIEPDLTTKKVTRLAFRKTSTGDLGKAYGRHGKFIHAINADGGLMLLSPDSMIVHMHGQEPQVPWTVPAFIGQP